MPSSRMTFLAFLAAGLAAALALQSGQAQEPRKPAAEAAPPARVLGARSVVV